ncbi:NAD(P)/FAD-dependent oxidoreductase [Desulfosoma sp.]
MGSAKRDVVIVGGGIMGLMTAYFLTQKGASVTVLEKGRLPCGSSYGNAGLIVPSHLQPLCSPANLKEGFRHLFNPVGPFSVSLTGDGRRLLWLGRFAAHCTEAHVARAVSVYRDLADRSLVLHDALAELGGSHYEYGRHGLLCVYASKKGFQAACEEAEALCRAGRPARVLEADALRRLEPSLADAVVGGILQEPDGSLNPSAFMTWLAQRVRDQGGQIAEETEVFGAEVSQGRVVRLRTNRGPVAGEQFVVAAGAWSGILTGRMGVRLPVEPAKGFSITYEAPLDALRHPLLLEEARVAVTPMEGALRLAGVLELSGFDDAVPLRRLDAMERDLTTFLPSLGRLAVREIWRGFRPCTPDGLPVIGRLRSPKNLLVGSGHATKGMFLGPVTGELLAEFLEGRSPAPSVERAVDPNRFAHLF